MKTTSFLFIYSLLIFTLIFPILGNANPTMILTNMESDYVNYGNCTSSLESSDFFVKIDNPKVTYSNFYLKIEYLSMEDEPEKVCRITLNGTIKTDVGDVTFDNFTVTIPGNDCVEIATRLLRSLSRE